MGCKISACAISQPRLVPTSRGRGGGIGGAPDEAVPKTGGRGKPLHYGMMGKHSAPEEAHKNTTPAILSMRKGHGGA